MATFPLSADDAPRRSEDLPRCEAGQRMHARARSHARTVRQRAHRGEVPAATQIQLDSISRGDRERPRYAYLVDSYNRKNDDEQALAADLDEFEGAIGDIDVDDLIQQESDMLATQAQKLGWQAGRNHRRPNCREYREKLARS